jgi:hypothetical protein
MSNQTLQKSRTKRRARVSASTRPGTFNRQTARLEGRRDGKPLIFGWGGHLTRRQKELLQRRAALAFVSLVGLIVLGVGVFGVIQQNVLIPNQAIVKINGVAVSQDQYRKALAYDAQVVWNRVKGELKEQGALLPKIQAGDAAATSRNDVLTSLIRSDESAYTKDSLSQQTISNMIEDQLIQQGAQRFERTDKVAASTFEPSANDITAKLNDFKKAFPIGESYGAFLDKNNISDADVRGVIAMEVRRAKMQTYLASLLVSPTRQVHLRRILSSSAADAQKILAQIQQDSSDAKWKTLAKTSSVDVDTKDVGGDMGWLVAGTKDAIIEDWALATSRHVNEISPVLKDVNGTYNVIQILAIDPSRKVDASTLDTSRSNALSHWLSGQRYNTSNHVTTPDSTMLTATRNLPVAPNLNATLPNEVTPTAGQ